MPTPTLTYADAGIELKSIPASRQVSDAGVYNDCLQYDDSPTLTLTVTLTQHSASVIL